MVSNSIMYVHCLTENREQIHKSSFLYVMLLNKQHDHKHTLILYSQFVYVIKHVN